MRWQFPGRVVGDAARIVEQDLAVAGLDQQRRQTGQVGIDRGGQGMGGRGVAQVVPRGRPDPGAEEQRVDGVVFDQAGARRRKVGPGRKQHRPRWQGVGWLGVSLLGVGWLGVGWHGVRRVAEAKQQGEREAAASRVAGEHDVRCRGAGVDQRAIGRHCIIERGWKRVFGRQAVVEGKQARVAPGGQPRGDRPMRAGRHRDIGAAVEIQDAAPPGRMRRRDRLDPFAVQGGALFAADVPAWQQLGPKRHPAGQRAGGRDVLFAQRLRFDRAAQGPAEQPALPARAATLRVARAGVPHRNHAVTIHGQVSVQCRMWTRQGTIPALRS